MKKFVFILSICIFVIANRIEAQNQTDSIQIMTGFRMKFLQHDTVYTKVYIKEIIKESPEASKKMKTSIITSNIGTILRFSGGVLIFIPLAEKIEGKTPIWTPAIYGIGLLAASLPLIGISQSNAENAVDIFNMNINKFGMKNPKYQFGITNDGIGLRIRL